MNALGIYGGTFDPIHYGHIQPILDVCRQTGIREVRYIPSARPGHRRAPRTDATHRLNMVALAIADIPGFVADDRELRRPGKSYMVPTLRQFRREYRFRPLCLILGADAFALFHRWYWRAEVLRLANIIVVNRFGSRLMPASTARYRRLTCDSPLHICKRISGAICHIETVPMDISSTRIRKMFAAGQAGSGLVPDAVSGYIAEHRLYR